MNKKTILIILLAIIVFPAIAYAVNTPTVMADKVKDLAVSIGVAIVVIGWVIAGILYLTAAGKPEKITTAKNAMIAAVIGTILVIIAKLGYDAIKALMDPIIG